ncbi:josephin-2-like [Anneissia japonica]|uniref:josephin-2-like n=1 Tax=Anneissia japonica TaxID=1529436 RepID=UPI0014257F8A|nr:josephin-2-like [Anneissia japonica]
MMSLDQHKVYHEKQRWEMCALHALNNIFQDGKAFNKQKLDEICQRLAPSTRPNPHKSMLGLGNYDVNVIMAALQLKECEAVWWDKRRNPSELNLPNIIGFIVNTTSPIQFGYVDLPFKRKHWIALRQVDNTYYNLDSKLSKPVVIGSPEELLDYLKNGMNLKSWELLLVVSQQVSETRTWLKSSDQL